MTNRQNRQSLHAVYASQLKEAEKQLGEMEVRLEASFERTRLADDALLQGKVAWKEEKYGLEAKIKDLEERLKYEMRRASQALDVADNASTAAGSIGRLVRQLVDEDVLAQLRDARKEKEERYRESIRRR